MKTNLVILYLFLIIASCSNKNQNNVSAQEYIKNNFIVRPDESQNPVMAGFDCDNFQYDVSEKYYVDKNGEPYLTEKDSADLITYAAESGEIKYALLGNKKDTNVAALFYLLPRTRDIINPAVYDSIILDKSESFKDVAVAFAKSIKPDASLVRSPEEVAKSFMLELTKSDAVVLGEVIDKRFVRDTAKCFRFKTEFIIRVDEVLHSYFYLEKNNNVLVNDHNGFSGGCDPKNPKLLEVSAHGYEFKVGDKGIFTLHHTIYYSWFITKKTYQNNYNDKYCSRVFPMSSWNGLYDYKNDFLLDNIRLFYKTLFKN